VAIATGGCIRRGFRAWDVFRWSIFGRFGSRFGELWSSVLRGTRIICVFETSGFGGRVIEVDQMYCIIMFLCIFPRRTVHSQMPTRVGSRTSKGDLSET
jgi:hypothetical protein